MLREYVKATMNKAHYKILEDQTFFGEIPEFQGVQANATMLEDCHDKLQEALEGRIILSLRKHLPLPIVDGIDLVGSLTSTEEQEES